ncbi:discoidin domain-containing protein [bacterium]|nr:discoidin domain-containing protein [bacterium]
MDLRDLRPVLATALLLALAVPLGAEELRSDEGVTIKLPDGWARRTAKLGPTTAIAIERAGSPDPRPAITVNVFLRDTITEEKAFKVASEIFGKAGEILERPSGRFYRVDLDADSDASKMQTRVYVAHRDKRVYYFFLKAKPESWKECLQVFEAVVDGATFFAVVAKEAPLPAPAPETAPVASPAEVARPKPRPAEPTFKAPEPQAKPEDFIVREPDPRKRDPAAETAPVASPVVPRGVRQAASANLLAAPSLVSQDSEYDPDIWAAKHLVDGSPTSGWCSAPSAKAPHRFVLELARAVDVARLSFDNACPEEKGFEGAAAREVVVEGSTQGARGPWRELARGTLARGKNDQSLEVPQNESRWLRISLLSNHGHPTLTELMEVRAFAAQYAEAGPSPSTGTGAPPAPTRTTDDGAFRVERLRLSKEKDGAALDPAVFAPGDTLWVYFKPRAMRLNEHGNYGLEVDLRLEDAKGEETLTKPKLLDHVGAPPKPPNSPYVSLKVPLPSALAAGSYVVRITVRDSFAQKELNERLTFEVKKAP